MRPATWELNGNLILWHRRRCRRLCFGGLSGNPLKRPRGNEAYDQEVLSAKALRVLPFVPFAVGTLERDIEHRTLLRLLPPDTGAHGTVADFVDWLGTDFR